VHQVPLAGRFIPAATGLRATGGCSPRWAPRKIAEPTDSRRVADAACVSIFSSNSSPVMTSSAVTARRPPDDHPARW